MGAISPHLLKKPPDQKHRINEPLSARWNDLWSNTANWGAAFAELPVRGFLNGGGYGDSAGDPWHELGGRFESNPGAVLVEEEWWLAEDEEILNMRRIGLCPEVRRAPHMSFPC